MDGFIHTHLMGQKIAGCFKDGNHLIIQAEDGHEYKIAWQDENGEIVKGEPVLLTLGCKIQLPSISIEAVLGTL